MPYSFTLTSPTTIVAYEGAALQYTPTTNAGTDGFGHSYYGGATFSGLPACFDQTNYRTSNVYSGFEPVEGLPFIIPGDTFTGQILQGTAGTYTWPLTLHGNSDAGLSFFPGDVYNLTVIVKKAVVINSPKQVSGIQGTTYTSGAPLYTFSYVTGQAATSLRASGLPPGMQVSGGKIIGTPTSYGTFNAKIVASNANGYSTFALVIAILQVPHITSPDSFTVAVNQSCRLALTTDTACTITAGSALPDGLELVNGIIDGTPTATGDTAVTLTAENANGSTTQNLTIHVISPPTITSASTLDVLVGASVNFTPTSSDGAAAITTSTLPTGLSYGGASTPITGSVAVAGVYPIVITATDGTAVGFGLFTLTVHSQVALTSTGPVSATQGATLDFPLTSNNSPASFQIINGPDWLNVTPNGHLTGVPPTAGTIIVAIRVDDGFSQAAAALQINIAAAPAITFGTPDSVTATVDAAYQLVINTIPAASEISISGQLPDGLIFVGNTIAGSPTTAGVYAVTLNAVNNFSTGSQSLLITVNPQPQINITSSLSPAGTVGDFFSYTVIADQPVTQYSITGLPDGLTANGALISGTPTASGVYSVSATVQGIYNSATATIALDIAAAPQIQITSSLTQSATQGQTFSYQITTNPLATSFAATGLPTGLTLDTASGIISGTPTVTGTFSVTLTATNSYGPGNATMTLTVAAPAVQSNPALFYRRLNFNVVREIVYDPQTRYDQSLDGFTVKLESACSIKLLPTDDTGAQTPLPVNSIVYFTIKPLSDYDAAPLLDAQASGVEADGTYILSPQIDADALKALFATTTDDLTFNAEVSWIAPGDTLPHKSATFTVIVENDVRKLNQQPVPPPTVYPPVADVALTADLAQLAIQLLDGTQFRFAGPNSTWYSINTDGTGSTGFTVVDPDSTFVNAQLRFPGPSSTWYQITVVAGTDGTPVLDYIKVDSGYGANAGALKFTNGAHKYTLSIILTADNQPEISWTQVS